MPGNGSNPHAILYLVASIKKDAKLDIAQTLVYVDLIVTVVQLKVQIPKCMQSTEFPPLAIIP